MSAWRGGRLLVARQVVTRVKTGSEEMETARTVTPEGTRKAGTVKRLKGKRMERLSVTGAMPNVIKKEAIFNPL